MLNNFERKEQELRNISTIFANKFNKHIEEQGASKVSSAYSLKIRKAEDLVRYPSGQVAEILIHVSGNRFLLDLVDFSSLKAWATEYKLDSKLNKILEQYWDAEYDVAEKYYQESKVRENE